MIRGVGSEAVPTYLPTCEVDDYELSLVLPVIKDGVEIADILHLDHGTALTCLHGWMDGCACNYSSITMHLWKWL